MEMFTGAFIQEIGSGRLRHEEQLLQDELALRGILVARYTMKDIHRRRLPLQPGTFVAGDVDAMHGAMRQLRVPVPEIPDYPDALNKYLQRRVWKSTLSRVEAGIFNDHGSGVFIKPADRKKAFTGRVMESVDDFRELGGTSRSQATWCAEAVTWKSEYRVYVCRGRIICEDHYRGGPEPLDMAVVRGAVDDFAAAGTAPAGYALDFGVLDTGATALVEFNDGYSLGAYSISGPDYCDLLMARWGQLVATAVGADSGGIVL